MTKDTPQDVVDKVLSFAEGTKVMIVAPVSPTEGRTLQQQLETYLREGYTRILVNNEVVRLENLLEETAARDSDDIVYLIIDRLSVSQEKDVVSRITDSVETAMYEGHGACRVVMIPSNVSFDFSSRFEADGITFEEPNDNMFSFNSPAGACPVCEGFGSVIGIDERPSFPIAPCQSTMVVCSVGMARR